MLKVVLDTNIFISGIFYGGNPRKIINLWLDRKYHLSLSPELKAEILNKLKDKIILSTETIHYIEESLDTYSLKYIPEKQLNICRDPRDNFLLELALESQADFIITGDKDLLILKKYKKTKIISPVKFLQILK